MYLRLGRLAREEPAAGLPDEISFHDLEIAYPVWLRWRALGKTHLPYGGGFLEQPEWLMDDLLTLDALYEQIRDLLEDNDRPTDAGSNPEVWRR